MSGKLIGEVYTLKLSHKLQSVAISLAEHANDDGTSIHPGEELTAWKTGYSVRNVRRIMEELEEIGLIVRVGKRGIGRGNVQEYKMDTSAVEKKPPFGRSKTGQVEHVKPDNSDTFKKIKPDKSDTKTGQVEHVKPDNSDIKPDKSDISHIRYARVEPSKNRTVEPSTETAPQKKSSSKIDLAWAEINHLPEAKKMAEICGVDLQWGLPKQFWDICQNFEPLMAMGMTTERLDRFLEWWHANDWRGKKGDAPKPTQMREVWKQFEKFLAGGNQHGINTGNNQPRRGVSAISKFAPGVTSRRQRMAAATTRTPSAD